jgi:hypothetical protein
MFEVKYLDSKKKIKMPNNLNDFKLKVKHIFSINSDFKIILKNKFDFKFEI